MVFPVMFHVSPLFTSMTSVWTVLSDFWMTTYSPNCQQTWSLNRVTRLLPQVNMVNIFCLLVTYNVLNDYSISKLCDAKSGKGCGHYGHQSDIPLV